VKRIAILILLQNQHARSLGKVRVIFHDACIGQTAYRLIRQYTVCGQLIVAMLGDHEVSTPRKFLDPF